MLLASITKTVKVTIKSTVFDASIVIDQVPSGLDPAELPEWLRHHPTASGKVFARDVDSLGVRRKLVLKCFGRELAACVEALLWGEK